MRALESNVSSVPFFDQSKLAVFLSFLFIMSGTHIPKKYDDVDNINFDVTLSVLLLMTSIS